MIIYTNQEGNYASSEATGLPEHFSKLDFLDQPIGFSLIGEWPSPESLEALSDCPTLSPISSPTESSLQPGMDDGAIYHMPGNWNMLPANPRYVLSQDSVVWPTGADDSVTLSLSPVHTHESRSSCTLTSLSEPDDCIFPPSWNPPYAPETALCGSITYSSPGFAVEHNPKFDCPPYSAGLDRSYVAYTSFAATEPDSDQWPEFYQGGPPVAFSSNNVIMGYHHPVRPLLPRSPEANVYSQPAYGRQRVLLPNALGARRTQPYVRNVSRTARGSLVAATSTSQIPPGSRCTPDASLPVMVDPTAEAFTAFIHVDQEDQIIPEDHLESEVKRESPLADDFIPVCSVLPVDGSMLLPGRNPRTSGGQRLDVKLPRGHTADKPVSQGAPSDVDEGRHRTHADYSRPPHPDGLYYCPYKEKEKCSHKPTKLKCNYEDPACSKQEFSSTACLLRHEREAHGMHGHGDRPHLCFYAGCDRGVEGHGFPRRYNLFDHMRRVHDHKDDAVDATGSPILGGETQKKIKGTKRKSSSPLASEKAMQRPKTLALPVQSHGVVLYPDSHRVSQAYCFPTSTSSASPRRPQREHRMPYHH